MSMISLWEETATRIHILYKANTLNKIYAAPAIFNVYIQKMCFDRCIWKTSGNSVVQWFIRGLEWLVPYLSAKQMFCMQKVIGSILEYFK